MTDPFFETTTLPARALAWAKRRAYLRHFCANGTARRLVLFHLMMAGALIALAVFLHFLLALGRDHQPLTDALQAALGIGAALTPVFLVVVFAALWAYPPGLGAYTASIQGTDAFQALVAEEEAVVRARAQAASLATELPEATRSVPARKRL